LENSSWVMMGKWSLLLSDRTFESKAAKSSEYKK
jgi:hypothetical protein